MAKRMLVDATQPEETRVVVVNGNRLEELDFEIASRKQLKGNIYLARVTRVEPSLQAAFIEYGGNRHGFLAFSEIHPDYYRIPVADREALMAEERRLAELADEADDEAPPPRRSSGGGRRQAEADAEQTATDEGDNGNSNGSVETEGEASAHLVTTPLVEDSSLPSDENEPLITGEAASEGESTVVEAAPLAEAAPAEAAPLERLASNAEPTGSYAPPLDRSPWGQGGGSSASIPAAFTLGTLIDTMPTSGVGRVLSFRDDQPQPNSPQPGAFLVSNASGSRTPEVETGSTSGSGSVGGTDSGTENSVGTGSSEADDGADAANLDVIGGDEVEDLARRRPRPLRSYKIQEVIKRRQILLVQVTKEERGTKGAALTTYLSLPGRYCVLMPNTGRGGGVSRKITNPQDRKRLKEMLSDLDIPQGMAVILRTAGLERSKAEIKRDLEYLLRLWDSIREQTFQSTAPELIYEEANLIKRSIRDLYANDIDEVLVEGERGYRLAKDFMRMLVPSHIKRVQQYQDDTIPLFFRYQVETQIDAIHGPIVQLKSGGYIVINPTEALVAIDVNSGRSTRERNIEETAFKTNLEASDEIARQLRLRDLAGLIVIDYIDMEDNRNNLAVERRLKEAMKTDRARIQLGRISPFGLLELSRQRMRPSLLETNFEQCPHCSGTGVVRSIESAALHALRAVEEEGIRRRSAEITVTVTPTVALYILNHKRVELAHIEQRYAMRVAVLADSSLIIPELRVERIRTRGPDEEPLAVITTERVFAEAERLVETSEEDESEEADTDAPLPAARAAESRTDDGGEEGRERRGRRGRRGRRRPGSGERPTDIPTAAPPVETTTETTSDTGEAESDETGSTEAANAGGEIGGDGQPRKRRRGKRGGRRRGRGREGSVGETGEIGAALDADGDLAPDESDAEGDESDDTEGNEAEDQGAHPTAVHPMVSPAIVSQIAPAPIPLALAPVEILPVEDFDWLLDDERSLTPTAPTPITSDPPIARDIVVSAPLSQSNAAEPIFVGPEPTEPDLTTAEPFPVAAETGAAEAGPTEETGIAEAASPRRRTRRRSPHEGDLEAVVVRRTRRRVKMAPNGEDPAVEVAVEVAPEAAAEVMPVPVADAAPPVASAPAHEEPAPQSPSLPTDSRIDSTEDGVAVAPTERPDQERPPVVEIITDAPLPAPSRSAFVDDATPAPEPIPEAPPSPPRRGWWNKG